MEESEAHSRYNLLWNGNMEWNDGWNMASQSSYDTAEKKNGSRIMITEERRMPARIIIREHPVPQPNLYLRQFPVAGSADRMGQSYDFL